ncbi:MAG: hypothetical protein ACRCXY_04495 [Fusobacteriaceae bacterium]
MSIEYDKLSLSAKDIDKAITSLREELEAINFYNMRAEQAEDSELKALLIHNRNEEIEHAAMLSEWLRRNMPDFNTEFRDYLFTEGSLTDRESAVNAGQEPNKNENQESCNCNCLGIGDLKK